MSAIGGEKAVLAIIHERIEHGTDGEARIFRHKPATLLRYIRTLFLLPFFDMERPIELDSYEGVTLEVTNSPDGKQVGYRTTDRFLRELTALNVGNGLSYRLARCYYEAFYAASGNRLPVYVDGHFKVVWTLKNIPRGKHGMMDRVMPGLKQVFLNGPNGHPLLHKTCAGDQHLKKELLTIVRDFEKAIGKETVNMVVVDGEGCSLDVFKSFDALNEDRTSNIYLLTILDNNQYRIEDFRVRYTTGGGEIKYRKVEENDFAEFKRKNERIISRVALAEFDYLSNANRRRNGKDSSGAELANLYYNR